MATIREMVSHINQTHESDGPQGKALHLLEQVRPEHSRQAVAALALMVFEMLAHARRSEARSPRSITTPKTTPSGEAKMGGSHGHASQKVALASRAWTALLTTEVTLPGSPARIAIQDMTADQLTTLADSLFDTHERIHRLAETVREAGVTCAAELPTEALAAIEMAA